MQIGYHFKGANGAGRVEFASSWNLSGAHVDDVMDFLVTALFAEYVIDSILLKMFRRPINSSKNEKESIKKQYIYFRWRYIKKSSNRCERFFFFFSHFT